MEEEHRNNAAKLRFKSTQGNFPTKLRQRKSGAWRRKCCPAQHHDGLSRKGDPGACLEPSTLGSVEKTWAVALGGQSLLWWANVWCVVGERERTVRFLWTDAYQRGKCREYWVEMCDLIATQPWPWVAARTHVCVQDLVVTTVLMSKTPDFTKGRGG